MTSAPAGLLEARRLLIEHLDTHPGQTVSADLDPAEVGIVGDAGHLGGYHCGRDRVRRDSAGNIVDYSVIESPRDRAGLDLDAAALDVGWFIVTTPRGAFNLRHFSAWLVGECERGAPDTLDIREVIYSLDGVAVKRWDRLKRRTTGDGSHRTHTHISEFRDSNGRKMPALMRRWLIHIGLIEGDTMADGFNEKDRGALTEVYQNAVPLMRGDDVVPPGGGQAGGEPHWAVGQIKAIAADVAALKARPLVEPAPVDPLALQAAVEACIPAIVKAVNDDAARRAAE
jgi:hypothetical protein